MILQRAAVVRGRAGRPADLSVRLRIHLQHLSKSGTIARAAATPLRIGRRALVTTPGAAQEQKVPPAPETATGRRSGALYPSDSAQDRRSTRRNNGAQEAGNTTRVARTDSPAAAAAAAAVGNDTTPTRTLLPSSGGTAIAAAAPGVLTTVKCLPDDVHEAQHSSRQQQQQQQQLPRKLGATPAATIAATPSEGVKGTENKGHGTVGRLDGMGACDDAAGINPGASRSENSSSSAGGGGGSESGVPPSNNNTRPSKQNETVGSNLDQAYQQPPLISSQRHIGRWGHADELHRDDAGVWDGDPNPNPTSEAYDDSWDRVFVLGGDSPVVDAVAGSLPVEDVGEGAVAADGVEAAAADAPGAGEERAHKMWVTMTGGKAVSEQEWEAEGPTGGGKEDAAVIQIHSTQEDAHSPFQGFGVIKEDKAEDIQTLVDSFTAPALASALRDRETALHICARLLEKGDLPALRQCLNPFSAAQVATSRRALRRLELDPEGFTKVHMYTLKKVLQRLPRHVTTLTEQRASVMIPLCNVDGVASVLFTKRSGSLRAHGNEVCFPGGKVDIGVDQHIIHTALREMGEEIGIAESSVDVLGVLRCDWSEVASLIGVAVTPVVGFLGNLSKEQINPNPDEVSHSFTIPIRYLLREDRWKTEKYKAPAFVGGPYVIWGLTGYILHRLVHDVLLKHLVIV